MKVRTVPSTAHDKKLLKEVPTEEEIKEARHLPCAPLLGVMTYPASNCKFEIKLATSKLGSRRNGWSKKHFEVVLRVFERAVATCEVGLMYSKRLDPRGENILCACAGASLETPRPHGCRIVMCNGACGDVIQGEETNSHCTVYDLGGARNFFGLYLGCARMQEPHRGAGISARRAYTCWARQSECTNDRQQQGELGADVKSNGFEGAVVKEPHRRS
jgi:hypothetical protein